MTSRISTTTFAVIGGDRREVEVATQLLMLGACVRVAGLPLNIRHERIRKMDSLEEAVGGADVVVAPVVGTDEEGYLPVHAGQSPLRLTKAVLGCMRRDSILFIGIARPWLRDWCEELGLKLMEFRERDEFAIYNSIPSAEGAIQMAMERLPITVHGSQCFVLGFGRTGKTLARMLAGIGAVTTVVARRESDLARIYEMGYRPVAFQMLGARIGQADVVFNTVPALVLDRSILSAAKKELVIIDLASSPGGTDFGAARELGIEAVLAPALPGKVAPRSAAKIIVDLLLRLTGLLEY